MRTDEELRAAELWRRMMYPEVRDLQQEAKDGKVCPNCYSDSSGVYTLDGLCNNAWHSGEKP